MTSIQSSLADIIRDIIKKYAWQAQLAPEDLFLDGPQDSRFGDLSSNAAMRLASFLKRPAREIAALIISQLKTHPAFAELERFVRDIRVEGAGFINFYLTEDYYYLQLKGLLQEGIKSLRVDLGRGRPVLVEFVSANPTGPLSVAHARQAAVGDALANALDFSGFRVCREYYLNDEGNQINILGDSLSLRLKELAGEKIEFPENYYQGDYIYEIAKQAAACRLQPAGLSAFAVNYILGVIRKELEDFGVRFDGWYSQRSLRESGKIEAALAFLKEKGFLYESEGALWFSSTKFGDDKDRVVIKSDRSYTYLAPDIAYHRDKYARGFSYLINLWGPDHHGYVSRLKAAVNALGYSPQSLSVIIVQLATIFRAGKPLQMSTRKGQYITLREVLDEVGSDAARFFFLMRRTSAHLDFDLELAKKQNAQNPVYYCQYAHARIAGILRAADKLPQAGDFQAELLKEPEELNLLKKICQFGLTVWVCVSSEDPYFLSVYLQGLAERFHKFYDRHRVLGIDPELSLARLALVSATKLVLAEGLRLLGVSQPERM